MNRLIAFTGLKRCGKTSAAEATRWRHINFADPLKAMIRAYLRELRVSEDMIYEYTEGQYKELAAPAFGQRSPRYAMQTLGTEWGRQIMFDGLWTEAYKMRVAMNDNVVTSDLRFLNEATTVKELGGTIVRIVRPGQVANDSHASETEMASIKADYVVTNDGSLKDLQRKVLQLVG